MRFSFNGDEKTLPLDIPTGNLLESLSNGGCVSSKCLKISAYKENEVATKKVHAGKSSTSEQEPKKENDRKKMVKKRRYRLQGFKYGVRQESDQERR